MPPAPAAVLVIDLGRREVMHANAAAGELTGSRVRLPVDIGVWGDAAGLTDLAGRPMRRAGSVLSLIASGVPVAGEPVEAGEDRLLWVTGFSIFGAEVAPSAGAVLFVQRVLG